MVEDKIEEEVGTNPEDSIMSPGEVDQESIEEPKKVLKKTKKKKKVYFSRPKKVFGTRAVAPSYTKEQNMLRSLFGHGPTVIMPSKDGRSLPKIHRTLTSGGGLIKSGDRGETRGLFGGGRPSPFFGRLRGERKDHNPIFGNSQKQRIKKRNLFT